MIRTKRKFSFWDIYGGKISDGLQATLICVLCVAILFALAAFFLYGNAYLIFQLHEYGHIENINYQVKGAVITDIIIATIFICYLCIYVFYKRKMFFLPLSRSELQSLNIDNVVAYMEYIKKRTTFTFLGITYALPEKIERAVSRSINENFTGTFHFYNNDKAATPVWHGFQVGYKLSYNYEENKGFNEYKRVFGFHGGELIRE